MYASNPHAQAGKRCGTDTLDQCVSYTLWRNTGVEGNISMMRTGCKAVEILRIYWYVKYATEGARTSLYEED